MNQTKQWYNENALNYIEASTSSDMKKGISPLVEKFLGFIKEKSGSRVVKILDVGCGSGRDAFEFAKRRCLVDAFDQSSVLIEEAKNKVERSNCDNPNFLCQSFEDIKPTEIYHGVWACASLLHVETENFEEVFKKLAGSLVSDGVFYFSIKKMPIGKTHYNDNGRDFYHPKSGVMETLFKELGLTLIDYFETGKVNDPLQTFENYFLIKK